MGNRMDPLQRKAWSALQRGRFIGSGALLVVAVSGGADSVALLHALLTLRGRAGLRLHVAHLNHDFRGDEADEDARFVARLGVSLDLPVTVEKINPVAYQREAGLSSFEEAAREVRYGFLARVARDTGAAAIALGHTADDQAETVLMHLVRGAGLHGLRGMEELSTWKDREGAHPARLFRPLLGATKQETAAYCQRRRIAFRTDSGNLSMRFTRNRVRSRLMPALKEYNPRIMEALIRLSRAASLHSDYLDGEVSKVWPVVARREGEGVLLDAAQLVSVHPLVRRLVFRMAYREVAGDTRRLMETHVTAMEGLLGAQAGRSLDLPRGLRLSRGHAHLALSAGPRNDACPFPLLEGEHSLPLPPAGAEVTSVVPGWRITCTLAAPMEGAPRDVFSALLDRDSLGERLLVRARAPGDRFQPLGMGAEKKLQDFFVDEKVPRQWRDRVPLLISERGIAWVVGYRVAQWARVGSGGGTPIRIEFAREGDGLGSPPEEARGG
jgi:tRNA(Ile)-lysidine synthase